MGEYRRRFFPHEENASPDMNACPCGLPMSFSNVGDKRSHSL